MTTEDDRKDYLDEKIDDSFGLIQSTLNENRVQLDHISRSLTRDGWDLNWIDHWGVIAENNVRLFGDLMQKTVTALSNFDKS